VFRQQFGNAIQGYGLLMNDWRIVRSLGTEA
jgi:hypothetical protein